MFIVIQRVLILNCKKPIETDPQIEAAADLFPQSRAKKDTASSSTKEVPTPINPNAFTPAAPSMADGHGHGQHGAIPSATSSTAQSTPSQLLADSTTSPGTERFGGAMIDDEEKRERAYGLIGGYHGAMDSDDTVESLTLGIHARHSQSGRITPFTPQNVNDGEEENARTLELLLAKHQEIAIGVISFLDQKSFITAHRVSRLFMYCARFPRSRSHLMIRVGKMGDKMPISGMVQQRGHALD